MHAITDFTLTSDSAVTIQTEHHSPIAVHLASLNGFADNLTLSCENLPAYASCTFANGAIPLSANQSIDSQVVIDAIRTRPAQVNIVATGRDAPTALIEIADTVTEMVKIRHAYDRGIKARRGIDF